MNPFRYRGYYYDTETGLYFLQTRYYDPEIGRFLTIDDTEYLAPETINGLNLYAYCLNNPVMRTDSQGTNWWTDFWGNVGNWFVGVGNAIWNGLTTAVTAVGNFFQDYGALIGVGLLAFGALAGGIVLNILTGGLVGSVLLGAGIGFFTGVTGNISNQISTKGLKNFNAWTAIKNGFKGAAIGAISGAVSFALGGLAQIVGRMAGNYISQMVIGGLNVGKAFAYLGGPELLIAFGNIAGRIIGGIVGGAYANQAANNLFGIYPSSNENMTEGVNGTIFDFIIEFFRWMVRG